MEDKTNTKNGRPWWAGSKDKTKATIQPFIANITKRLNSRMIGRVGGFTLTEAEVGEILAAELPISITGPFSMASEKKLESGAAEAQTVEVKAWIGISSSGKPQSFLRSLNVSETEDRAWFIALADERVVPCTITDQDDNQSEKENNS